jgi:hypothetical protein
MLKRLWAALLGGHPRDRDDAPASAVFPPEVLVIPHDDHHGRWVGRLPDGQGIFITTPFVPAAGVQTSREFLALYRFSPEGDLLEARIEALGSREDLVGAGRAHLLPGNVAEANPVVEAGIRALLASCPGWVPGDIKAKPFRVERFGLSFGLIPDSAEDFDDDPDFEPVYVSLMPGNYMAFMAPWDGSYDT